ncbi:MAG TPA: hypothetical protein VGM88_07695 [Kofleriaceae bacterium]|jgi:hypothetical protein
MFVNPLRRGTQSAVFVGLGVAAFAGACGDPTLSTDLRSDGPPETLAVLVMNDPSYFLKESATFCKTGDDKRPGLVSSPPGDFDEYTLQVCPADLTMSPPEVGTMDVAGGLPEEFWVRIEFDELLDPTVEDLIDNPDGTTSGTLRNTKPVTLTCGGATVEYDGYYDPSGDAETWPLGPSLRIQPLDSALPLIATGSECSISINGNVKDKDGNPVPSDETGPFKFYMASMELLDQSPEPPDDPTNPDTVDPAAPIQLEFNAFPDAASLTPANVSLTVVNNCTDMTVISTSVPVIAVDADDSTVLDISDAAAASGDALQAGVTYSLSFAAGTSVNDSAATPGSVDISDVTTCFSTDAG